MRQTRSRIIFYTLIFEFTIYTYLPYFGILKWLSLSEENSRNMFLIISFLIFCFPALNNFPVVYSFLSIYFLYLSLYLRYSSRRLSFRAPKGSRTSYLTPPSSDIRKCFYTRYGYRRGSWPAVGGSYRDSSGKLTSINHIADECRFPRSLPLTFVTFYYNAFIRPNVHTARLRDIFRKKTTHPAPANHDSRRIMKF